MKLEGCECSEMETHEVYLASFVYKKK